MNCPTCHGNGSITCHRCSGHGKLSGVLSNPTCGVCDGKGQIQCPNCGGTGQVKAK